MDPRARTITQGSVDNGPDSQAITVRTPNAPPLERPVVITRDGRVIDELSPAIDGPRSPNSTLPMSGRPVPSRIPLSARAPASRQSEAQWFEKEPLVAPGVAELPEPSHAAALSPTLEPPSHRGRAGGFAMVAVLLVGIAVAGSVFFLSSTTADEAKAPATATTTQITNAEVPAAAPVVPEPVVTAAAPPPTPPKPAVKTVRAVDLPSTLTPSYAPAPSPSPAPAETSSETPELQENR